MIDHVCVQRLVNVTPGSRHLAQTEADGFCGEIWERRRFGEALTATGEASGEGGA